jgi:hypothetical protein
MFQQVEVVVASMGTSLASVGGFCVRFSHPVSLLLLWHLLSCMYTCRRKWWLRQWALQWHQWVVSAWGTTRSATTNACVTSATDIPLFCLLILALPSALCFFVTGGGCGCVNGHLPRICWWFLRGPPRGVRPPAAVRAGLLLLCQPAALPGHRCT